MRILNVNIGVPYGGVGKCIIAYSRLTKKEGFEIHNVCLATKTTHNNFKNHLGVAKAEADFSLIIFNNWLDLSWIKKSKALIDEYKPDVLFVHGFNGPVIARLLQWKLKHKLPFVCSYHGLYYAPKRSRKILAQLFNSMMFRIYRKNAYRIISVSEYSKKLLLKKGVSSEKVNVIYNALPDNVFESEKKKLFKESVDNSLMIGTVTRLVPFKGLEFLLEAFAAVEAERNINLIIIGDGPYKQVLEQKCVELEISNKVVFAGYRSDIDVCLEELDIFVLPSLFENHSIALLEAMRAGKSIIATDVGGNTESVRDNKEALIVPAKDCEALANAMKTMINDLALRERVAKAARKRFEAEFTEKVMLNKLADWFCSFEIGK